MLLDIPARWDQIGCDNGRAGIPTIRIKNGTAMCGRVRIDKVMKLVANERLEGAIAGKN